MKKIAIRISPFANESDSLSIGGLTVENRIDHISLYGSLDITRDMEGLGNAERLKILLDDMISVMKGEHLPDKISIEPSEEIPNPFAD